MTFFESIRTVFRKYADFSGRATRPEFWWFTLFSALVASALGALNLTSTTSTAFGTWMSSPSLEGGATSSTLYLGASLASFWSIAVFLPSLAVAVRRLRDAGRKWTELFWILLPIAGIIILIVRWAEPTAPDAPASAAPAPPASTTSSTS